MDAVSKQIIDNVSMMTRTFMPPYLILKTSYADGCFFISDGIEYIKAGIVPTYPFYIKDHLQKSWSDPEGSRGQGFKDSSEILNIFNMF